MRTLPVTFLAAAALLALPHAAPAADLLPADKAIHEAIDHYIDAALQQDGVKPAPPAGEAVLLRRLTLDLVGRIPTAAEARAYLESRDPNKRVQLVERLMASPGFARHQATEFDTMLMDGTQGTVRDFLLMAFKEKRSWDRIFRDLMLPDEKDPRRKGSSAFLRQRVRDLDKLTAEVSVVFFGVNVSCAKCHDHPLVRDWKQDHFYGMKAFFNRTYEQGGFVAERPSGVVKFKTTKGQERLAKMMFLTGKVVDDPTAKDAPKDEPKPTKKRRRPGRKSGPPPPPPKFSARAQLVELALQPGQRDFFSRSLVNRVWHRLLGHGLVTPVDQMHSENPPSHPELLAWLARDTAEHGYDIRRLIRGIVLSRTYARSSRWEGKSLPRPTQFAVARLRALTPMQLAASLRLATTDPVSLMPGKKPEELEKRLESLEASARGYARMFEQPRDDFQIGVSEALLFSNGEQILREFLADGGDRLVGRLKQIKDTKELIDTAVRNVLSRPPTADEVKLLGDYLEKRKDRRVEACRQVVWALLTSAEFRFNY